MPKNQNVRPADPAAAARLMAEGKSETAIAEELGTTRWEVRKALGRASSVALVDVDDPLLRSAVVKALRGGWRNLDALALRQRVARMSIDALMDHLAEAGYLIVRDGPRARIVREPRTAGRGHKDASPLVGEWRRIGVVSDTHLCSKYCRLDVLNAAYDRFAAERITEVYHAGNLADGECKFNQYDLLAHGVTDQAMYCLDHYPYRPGITTHYISGSCHEGWWMSREGIDFGRYLAFEAAAIGRKDLHYLGFMEADIRLETSAGKYSYLRLLHPGGGSAYALSYRPQKIIESLQGGEKPAVLLCGHFHKQADFAIRNVWTILAGCTQDQTPFMRKHSIEAHVGFCVVEMQQDAKGAIRRVRVEHTSYYDRGYHEVDLLAS